MTTIISASKDDIGKHQYVSWGLQREVRFTRDTEGNIRASFWDLTAEKPYLFCELLSSQIFVEDRNKEKRIEELKRVREGKVTPISYQPLSTMDKFNRKEQEKAIGGLSDKSWTLAIDAAFADIRARTETISKICFFKS